MLDVRFFAFVYRLNFLFLTHTTRKKGQAMLPEYFEFSLPTRLVYGIGILGNLGETLKPFGKRRALLVTDEILVKVGPVDRVKEGFKGSRGKGFKGERRKPGCRESEAGGQVVLPLLAGGIEGGGCFPKKRGTRDLSSYSKRQAHD